MTIREVGVSLLAVAGFGVVLWRSRIAAAGERIVDLSLSGLMAMLDAEATDRTKELAVRRAGLGLVIAGLGLLWRFGLAFAAAAAPILLADALGVVDRDAVVETMLHPVYLVAITVLAVVLATAIRRWRPPVVDDASANGTYSTADRFFHAVAFSNPRVLKAASRAEDRLLSACAHEATGPPIFVTSLTRGGTTAVLNALHDVPGVATHTYRDMPFLTAPSLWYRLSGGKRRRVERRPRAHGDGLEIDLDSPEAFEEVIWKLFWPEKYRGDTIERWRCDDRRDDADRFLQRHMEKVIAARLLRGRDDPPPVARYCSKNNANIARIPYLVEAFPGCRIVVPVRRPDSHAASLLRQHQNFLRLQAGDDFVARYMRDIGHFEFGVIHKPIAFEGFDAEGLDPMTGDYWMHYWLRAFEEVLEHRERCVLVSQDSLRSAPQDTMTELCAALELPDPALQFADYFHSRPDEPSDTCFDPRLHAQAAELYRELEATAV